MGMMQHISSAFWHIKETVVFGGPSLRGPWSRPCACAACAQEQLASKVSKPRPTFPVGFKGTFTMASLKATPKDIENTMNVLYSDGGNYGFHFPGYFQDYLRVNLQETKSRLKMMVATVLRGSTEYCSHWTLRSLTLLQ